MVYFYVCFTPKSSSLFLNSLLICCSGGIGQTGTFIALDSLLDQGQSDGQVDVFNFVSHMRTERMDMIETQVGQA